VRRFQKKIENFVCGNCLAEVAGNGYTNHCPKCLFSKHVDINPGDRLNSCGGMMKPLRLESQRGEFVIIHKCQECGVGKRNKASPKDKLTF